MAKSFRSAGAVCAENNDYCPFLAYRAAVPAAPVSKGCHFSHAQDRGFILLGRDLAARDVGAGVIARQCWQFLVKSK